MLCIAIIGLAVIEFLVATIGYQIVRMPASTDLATYYLAGEQAREGLSPYDEAALARRGRDLGFGFAQYPFLYPPPFALAMVPLAQLSYPQARQVWMVIATVALLAALAITAALLRAQSRQLGIANPWLAWLVFTAFVPVALNSTSVHNDIRAGSVGCLLFLASAAIAWGLTVQRQWVSGAALALATSVKLTPIVAIPYAAWRGSWRAAIFASFLLAVSLGAALAYWGWDIAPTYVRDALLPALGREFPRPMNQSLDAVLARLLVTNDEVRAFAHLPWLKQTLSFLGGLAIVTLTLRTLLQPRRRALLAVEYGTVTLALLLVMKITWVHTFAAMLFVWPCAMIAIVSAAERGAPWAVRTGLWACAGFFLSSAHFPILWQGFRAGPQSLLVNVHVVGLVILWLVSRKILAHQHDVVGDQFASTDSAGV